MIRAVAAENQYGNVISQIGGRYVDVSSVLHNPNADPHSFEASTQVAQEISQASLVVQNGLGYDSFMDDIESASPNSSRHILVVQHVIKAPPTTTSSNTLQVIEALETAGTALRPPRRPDRGHTQMNTTPVWEYFVSYLIPRRRRACTPH